MSYRDTDKMDTIKKQADVVRIMEHLKENPMEIIIR